MIKQIPAFFPPAGATPNELAATGPGSIAEEWALARRDTLALERAAEAEAEERRRILTADRFLALEPLFVTHVRELEARTMTGAHIGAGAGVLLGGAWGAFKWTDNTIAGLLRQLLLGVALGAAAGFAGGHLYERVYGAVRPRIAPQIPQDVEAKVRQQIPAGEDVPAWRVEGWRAIWASLAAEYMGTPPPAVALPPGAPSPTALVLDARRIVPKLLR